MIENPVIGKTYLWNHNSNKARVKLGVQEIGVPPRFVNPDRNRAETSPGISPMTIYWVTILDGPDVGQKKTANLNNLEEVHE